MKVDIYNTDKKYNSELDVGKAGEHLVCSLLIKQGYTCFLTDQGLPYDVLIEKDGSFYTVQVKTTTKKINTCKQKNIYRFGLRNGKGSTKRYKDIDIFAFVFLDIMKVAFLKSEDLINKNKEVIQTVEFRSCHDIVGKQKGKLLEDYEKLNLKEGDEA